MKYKDLTQVDIDVIKAIHAACKSEERDAFLANHFEINQRTVRTWVSKLGISAEKVEAQNEQIQAAKVKEISKKRCYFIGSAQNQTPLHENLFANMQKYAPYRDAEILIIPFRYKNPTSLHKEKDDLWDKRLTPYLCLNRQNLNNNLCLLGDIPIQPTASDPLSRLEGITGLKTAIAGHPRQHCRSLPVVAGNNAKGLFSTGACTIENYTSSKAGKVGEFHHVLGFLIAEIEDDEIFYIRNVSADENGNFIDVTTEVKDGVIYEGATIEALVLADLHSEVINKNRYQAVLDNLPKLRPEKVYLQDVADGMPVNPHEKENYVLRVQRYNEGKHLVSDAIECVLDTIQKIKDAFNDSEIHVVRSNHDEFFDRWANSHNWKHDLPNAETYFKLVQIAISSKDGIIPYLIKERFGDAVKCLKYNESHTVCGIEMSLHGHAGNNGAKGGIKQFAKLSTKLITAHNHGYAILDGVMQVGTCTDRFQAYNKGASSSAWADGIINANGKKQLLIWNNGKFSMFF